MITERASYLHILGEVVVHVQVYGREVPRIVEFEGYFNRTSKHTWCVVSPTYPLVPLSKQKRIFRYLKEY